MDYWNTCLNIGNSAEQRAKALFENEGYKVVDVSNDWTYRKQDVDFIVITGIREDGTEKVQWVEIKNGDKAPYYGTVCVETEEPINKGHDGKGWLHYSAATFFGWQIGNELWLVNSNELREHIADYEKNGTYKKQNICGGQDSMGYRVPLMNLKHLNSFKMIKERGKN